MHAIPASTVPSRRVARRRSSLTRTFTLLVLTATTAWQSNSARRRRRRCSSPVEGEKCHSAPEKLRAVTRDLVITDGGMETTLIFHDGIELPEFAAFPLLDSAEGRAALERYFEPYLAIARAHGARFQLDTPTWRANRDWGASLGYDRAALDRVNRDAVAFARGLAAANPDLEVRVSGLLGPRGDGYVAGERMEAEEARAYHAEQIGSLAGADVISALTLTYPAEAIGIVRAATEAGLPAIVSFTVETDGRLPDG